MARLVGQKEVVQAWLYDSFTLEEGVAYTNATFFQVPLGQAGKTQYDTNLETSAQLPGVNALTVTAMLVKIEDKHKAVNFQKILSGYMGLMIGQKVYPDWAPIWLYQGGPSYRIAVAASSGADYEYALGGDASIRNVLKFSRAFYISIRPGETFRVEMHWPDAITLDETVKVWVMMFGLRERAVQ